MSAHRLKLGAGLAALFVTAVAGCCASGEPAVEKPSAAETKAAVESNTRFACDLYAKLREKGGNLFFSPYSISSALAMTYVGARGNTAKEMRETLHFTLEDEKLHAAFVWLTHALDEGGKRGSCELSVANALWGQKGYRFLDEFLTLNREHYGAGLELVDFKGDAEGTRKAINAWVESQTHRKIKELLKRGDVDGATLLVLTNAIYFKGRWASQFEKEYTKDEPFNLAPEKSVRVPLMRQTEEFGYMETPDFQALEMPYRGEYLSMVVFLPRKVDGLARFEKSLTAESLAKWLSGLRAQEVFVVLPRFRMTLRYGLEGVLSEMGMSDAFTMGAADFSGMDGTKQLFISKVIHKAFVAVDEEGTEAAAATAVAVSPAAPVFQPPAFRADHPFLFLIRDRTSGTILFLGRVVNPETEQPPSPALDRRSPPR